MKTSQTSHKKTFINKYKPKQLADFNYDTDFISVFNSLIKINDLNILLVGLPSSGKTTLLYALIRHYFNLKDEDYISENNILFINNLKEQGITYFRNEMKLFCQSKSSIFGKKKLIIIDDLDMISEQNQQVFRNYIDKYKNNIYFISVCTNIQKVIESIQSRIHVLKIPQYTQSYLQSNIIDKIMKAENIHLSKECRDFVFKSADNSIRQIINNLEKIYIYIDNENHEPQITIEECKNLCSNISFHHFENYINKIREKKLAESISIIYNIHDYGYSVIDILDLFFAFIKSTELLDDDLKYKIIPIICKYISIFHIIHENIIELALFTNEIYSIL